MLQLARTRLAWMAVAILLAARALLPMGWMPVEQAGGIRIELCTAHGAITATLDSKGQLHKDGEEEPADDACPYAVMAAPADTPSIPALAALLPPIALAPPVLAQLAVAPYPQGPRPPTRGPPSLA
jgi:hypothetical protein